MDPRKIESFARTFEPSADIPTDDEKLKAHNDFKDLIYDVLLANMADVRVSEHKVIRCVDEAGETTYDTERSASYHTSIYDRTPEGRYISSLEISVSDSGDEWRIQMQERDKLSTYRMSTYHTSPNSTEVLRQDSNRDQQRTPSDSEPDIESLTNGLDKLLNEAKNEKLEKAMGLNNQAVDSEEIARLRELLLPQIR